MSKIVHVITDYLTEAELIYEKLDLKCSQSLNFIESKWHFSSPRENYFLEEVCRQVEQCLRFVDQSNILRITGFEVTLMFPCKVSHNTCGINSPGVFSIHFS